jgi:hypothetical protein
VRQPVRNAERPKVSAETLLRNKRPAFFTNSLDAGIAPPHER